MQSLLESAKAPLPLNGNTLNDRKQNRKRV